MAQIDSGGANVLKTKALGIGEKHTVKAGREFALSLLKMRISSDDNLVRHLFIEIMAKQQGFVDTAAERVSKKELLKNIMSPLIAAFGGQEDCKIRIEDVVSTALLKGVKVHCADVNLGTNAERMTERNNGIAQKVFDVAQTNFSGCLLLFGSDHFDGAETNNPLVPTLCQNELLKDRMDWVKF